MKNQEKILFIGAAFLMAAVLVSTLVFAQETNTTTLEEKDAPATGESALSSSQTDIEHLKQVDTDQDGVSDYDEIYVYGTNPLRESTDGDAYDDGQELFGFSAANYGQLGGQMPAYVKWPGNSPFVAAYPQVDFTVNPQFKVFIHKELHFANRTTVNIEHTFGTIVTRTLSTSYGIGDSHTVGGYQDIKNSAADSKFASESKSSLQGSSTTTSQQEEHSKVKKSGWDVNAGADVTIAGPKAEISGAYSDYTTTTDKIIKSNSVGKNVANENGTSSGNGKIIEKSETLGTITSSAITATTSNGISTSISSVDLYTIGKAEEWEEGWSQDTTDAAKLRFIFDIKNTGTDRTVGISDLRFTIKIIGHNTTYTKTYPDLTGAGISLPALNPGESRQYNAEITLTLDELKEFDTKGKVQIYVEDYNFGNSKEEAYAQDAYDGGVLFIVDDGSKDDTTNLAYYLVHAEPTDTYIDLLKRLNSSVPVGSPQNFKKALDVAIVNNTILSIKGLEVADNAAWFVQTEGISEKPFLSKEINGGGRKAILTYSKDSDNDFYPDRVERKIGTNPDNANSFPAPKVSAAYLLDNITLEDSMPKVSYKVKVSNSGNYDAYGMEARLFSPNEETNVTKTLVGGAVRIRPNQTFVLNGTLDLTTPRKMQQSGVNLASLGRDATATGSAIGSADTPPVTVVGQPANEIIDGDAGTNSYFNGEGAWQINLSNYEFVSKIRLNLGNSNVVRVWVSRDGENWKFAGGNPSGYWGSGWNDVEFAPTVVKYIKLTLHPNGGETPTLREVEVLGYQYNGKSLHEFAQPKIIVLYNTPQGDERFVTDEKISNANESIDQLSAKMIHSVKLDASVPAAITYGNSGSITVSFTNPTATTVQKSRLAVSVLGPDGRTVKGFDEYADLPQGTRTLKVTLDTSALNKSLIGQSLTIFAAAVDHNNVMLAETLETIKIENPVRITNYIPGDVPAVIALKKGETKQFVIYASADSQLAYKWHIDGVQIPGAALNTYVYNAPTLGNHTLKTVATDRNYENSHSWNITVNGVPNRAPVLEPIQNFTVNVGKSVVVTPNASDLDNDNLTYAFNGVLVFSSLNNGSWATTPQQNGTFPVVLSVSDPSGASANQSFTVAAIIPNRAPVLEPLQNITTQVGQGVVVTPRASDPDGGALTIRFAGDLVFSDMNDGTWRAIPQSNGTFPITVTATDTYGERASQNFTVYANKANNTTLPTNSTNTTNPGTPFNQPATGSSGGGGGGGGSSGNSSKCNIGYELKEGKCVQKQILNESRVDSKNSTASMELPEKPAVKVQPAASAQTPEAESGISSATSFITLLKKPASLAVIAVVLIAGAGWYLFTRKYKISFSAGGGENEQ